MIPFSDIEPFLQYLQDNFVNTGLYIKVYGLNRNSNDLWDVEEISQLLSFQTFDQFKNSYELFRSSNIDIEYVQYKSFETSVKIYVKSHRLVLSLRDSIQDLNLEEIRDFAKNMNLSNIVVTMKLS